LHREKPVVALIPSYPENSQKGAPNTPTANSVFQRKDGGFDIFQSRRSTVSMAQHLPNSGFFIYAAWQIFASIV